MPGVGTRVASFPDPPSDKYGGEHYSTVPNNPDRLDTHPRSRYHSSQLGFFLPLSPLSVPSEIWVCTLGGLALELPSLCYATDPKDGGSMDRDACISESNRPRCVQYVLCLIYPGSVIVPILQLVAFTHEFPWREGEDSESMFP